MSDRTHDDEAELEALGEQIKALRKALAGRARQAEKAREALDPVARRGALGRDEALVEAAAGLRRASTAGLGLEEEAGALVERLEEVARQRRQRARLTLMGALHEAARARELEVVKLADQPPTLLIAPMVVELGFERGAARVLYAREEVRQVGLDAEAIIDAREAAMGTIREASVASARFFEMAQQAYELVRQAQGLGEGERVDLVDLLGPLALLRTEPGRWRALGEGGLEPYPRFLLAYQLGRLRRDRMLEHNGARLELGTATGGSTRDKRGVLFIPHGAGEGQYYLSLRFTTRRGG